MQEEFLRKLSKSGYDDFLILKGGLFIYTLTNFESRATIDVDFLLRGYSNSVDNVKNLIFKIIGTPTGNDYIEMTAKGFELTGRMKDFYDIYYLSRTFDFEGAKLQSAIFHTLQRRGTPYERIR